MPAKAHVQAQELLRTSTVIDGLGGSVVHPTPHMEVGHTYEALMVDQGWTAFNACLVSEPSYTPTWDETMGAVYENLVYLSTCQRLRLCERVEDIERASQQGQLGIFFGLQSADCLGADRTRIVLLHKLGLRVLQLTYMQRNLLGDGCLEPENRGLTHYGIQVVRECNRVGIVVDCSHVGVRTTLDAVRYSEHPIVVSHTGARALSDNPRCVSDEQITAIANKGGIVGITPYSPFIRSDRRADLNDYVDHFDHVIRLVSRLVSLCT